MLLVPCDAIAGAHGAGIEFAAMAVVVAHLRRLGEALGGISATARRGRLLGHRIVLDIPFRPVERCLQGPYRIRLLAPRRRKTEQTCIVHARGIEQPYTVRPLKTALDWSEWD